MGSTDAAEEDEPLGRRDALGQLTREQTLTRAVLLMDERRVEELAGGVQTLQSSYGTRLAINASLAVVH